MIVSLRLGRRKGSDELSWPPYSRHSRNGGRRRRNRRRPTETPVSRPLSLSFFLSTPDTILDYQRSCCCVCSELETRCLAYVHSWRKGSTLIYRHGSSTRRKTLNGSKYSDKKNNLIHSRRHFLPSDLFLFLVVAAAARLKTPPWKTRQQEPNNGRPVPAVT